MNLNTNSDVEIYVHSLHQNELSQWKTSLLRKLHSSCFYIENQQLRAASNYIQKIMLIL